MLSSMSDLDSNSSSEQPFTVNALDRGSKYLYERLGAGLCFVVCIGGAAIMAAIMAAIFVPKDFPPSGNVIVLLVLSTTVFGGLAIYMVRCFIQSGREAKLTATDKQPDFVINAEGVSGSLAMLEGSQRDQIFSRGEARFSLNWNDIVTVTFVPAKSNSRNSSRPLMIIHPKGAGKNANDYYVTRNSFYGKEQHIVDVLRSHGAHVAIEGELR